MVNKKVIGEIIKVGLILFAITAISAAVLALADSYTRPVIEENNKIAQNEAMKKVLPEADDFQKLEFTQTATVDEVYISENGYAVKVSPKGYGGEIGMIVGIDNELLVTGVEIITQSETAGLGANCKTPEFRQRFIGKTENIKVVKNGAKDNEVDAISSATITTKAVTLGVNEAISTVKSIKEGK